MRLAGPAWVHGSSSGSSTSSCSSSCSSGAASSAARGSRASGLAGGGGAHRARGEEAGHVAQVAAGGAVALPAIEIKHLYIGPNGEGKQQARRWVGDVRCQGGCQLAHPGARPDGSGHDFFTRGGQRGNGGHREHSRQSAGRPPRRPPCSRAAMLDHAEQRVQLWQYMQLGQVGRTRRSGLRHPQQPGVQQHHPCSSTTTSRAAPRGGAHHSQLLSVLLLEVICHQLLHQVLST